MSSNPTSTAPSQILSSLCLSLFTGHWFSESVRSPHLASLFAAASSWPGSPRERVRCWPAPAASPSRSEKGEKMCKFGPLWLIDMRPRQRVGICLCDLQDLELYLFMIELYLKGKMQGDPSGWCPHFANLHLILQHYKSPWNGTPKQVQSEPPCSICVCPGMQFYEWPFRRP